MKAAERVAEMWKTKPLNSDPRCIGFLSNIEIPSKNLEVCSKIAMEMLKEDHCFPKIYQFDGAIYCRISAQIYNELSDYEFMAKRFLERLAIA